ncbi:PhaM family polyhydroxyalkanoate granule multifunctional regulatory protein [Ideonella dechloratans]|uniref:PhaM family polyhydroxyalkanoate granule multifunctional regulatory protein n=1 Tax=Ideonella dechloratans TaxID=36863 RepID=UPI0035B46AF9
MSESASPFPALMPGFDFLQGLVRQAGTALPGMNAWITPTLDPEELDKRISELRTVQFWLEQNARLLGTTIQGLEVQRMTLNTLRSMNVSMGDLREAMAIRPTPEPAAEPAPGPTPDPAPAPEPPAGAEGGPAPGLVDPMQWWGALTQQFGQIAAQALKDAPATVQAMAQASQAAATPPAAARPGKAAPSANPKKPASARPAARKTAAKTSAKTSAKAAVGAGGAARPPVRAAAKKASPR